MYGHYLNSDMHGYFQVNQRIHESTSPPRATKPCARPTTVCRPDRASAIRQFRAQTQRWGRPCASTKRSWMRCAPRRSELSDTLFQHLRNKRTAGH